MGNQRWQRVREEGRNAVRGGLVLLVIGTVLGFISAVHPLFDWFADFRQIYAICAILPFVAFLRHDRRVVGAAVAVMVVNGALLLPWAPLLPDGCESETVAMSFNALGHLSDPERLVAQIEAEDPEIVFISELHPDVKDRVAPLFESVVSRPDAFGIGLFTKYPVESVEVVHSAKDRPFFNVVLSTPRGPLRVIGAHANAPFDSEGAADRNETLLVIADLASASAEPVVLVGDLNVTMFSPHYQPLERAGLRNVRHGRGVHATWPTFSPLRIPIDHVLHSKQLEVCEVEVGDSFGSDHLPLRAGLAWRQFRHTVASR